MNVDTEKPKRTVPTEASLIARIRMRVERNGEEVGIGDRVILQTDQNIYGFFELLDKKYPYMAIRSPLDSNPYNPEDSTVILGYVQDIAKDYILETNNPSILDINSALELVSMTNHQISLKEEGQPKYYEILSTGEVYTHSNPKDDIYIQDIPEPD
jgi:hypothetical protein